MFYIATLLKVIVVIDWVIYGKIYLLMITPSINLLMKLYCDSDQGAKDFCNDAGRKAL